jgi:hypothetical protein
MTIEISYCKQGTLDWFHRRLGIVTASNVELLLKSSRRKGERSQSWATYLDKLLAQRLTHEVTDNYKNEHMDRGHEDEPHAKNSYEIETGNEVIECGFITKFADAKKTICVAGYSPDGLVGNDGAIEIKSKLSHLHVRVMINDIVPTEHIAQIQSGLWISEREWCDFVCYSARMPLFIRRVYRDEKLIEKIEDKVRSFNYELAELEEQMRQRYPGEWL